MDVSVWCSVRWLTQQLRCSSLLQALIWVIDSSDRERLGGKDSDYSSSAYEELQRAMSEEELQHCPVLIFANKQDLPNAMSVQEITDRLQLAALRERDWLIQGCCAMTGDGLYEGIEWLSGVTKRKKKPTTSAKTQPKPMDQVSSASITSKNPTSNPSQALSTGVQSAVQTRPIQLARLPPSVTANAASNFNITNQASTLTPANNAAYRATTDSYPPLVNAWPSSQTPAVPKGIGQAKEKQKQFVIPRHPKPISEANAADTKVSYNLEMTHTPLVQLSVRYPVDTGEVVRSTRVGETRPVVDSEFVIVEQIEQPGLSEEGAVWLDSNGNELRKEGEADKTYQLRMIEAC